MTGANVIWWCGTTSPVQHARGPVGLEDPERTLRKVFGPMNLDPDEVLKPTYSKVSRPSC